MRRIVYGFLGLLGILLGIAVAIPFFINVNDYKPQIISKAKEALGRDVTIDGQISLHLLPMPQVSIEQVGVGNIPGGTPKDFIRIKSLQISVELWPLLKNQLKIKSVDLDQPEIFLEKLPSGQVNWNLTPQGNQPTDTTPSPSPAASSLEIGFEKVMIHQGHLVYHEKGNDVEIQDINATAKLETLHGPYEVSGDFKALGQPIKITSKLGSMGESQDINMSINFGTSNLSLTGIAYPKNQSFKGALKADVDPKMLKSSQNQEKPSALLSNLIHLESDVVVDVQGLILTQAKFKVGSAQPTGDINVSFKDGLQIKGTLQQLPGQGQFTFNVSPSSQGIGGSIKGTVTQSKELLSWLEVDTTSLPPQTLGAINLSTNFSLGEATSLHKLNIMIQDATLQGDISLHPSKAGSLIVVDLQTPKIENVMKLFGSKDPKHLGLTKLKGNIHWGGNSLKIDHLKGQLGSNLTFAGDVAIDQSKQKPNIKANLHLNSINMSTLMASRLPINPYEAQVFLVSAKPSSPSRWSHNPIDLSFLSSFDGHFTINADQLSMSDFTLTHPKMVANLQNGRLDISSLTGSIFDGSLVGNGHVTANNNIHFQLALKNANLKNLATHGSNVKIVGGKLFFTSDLTSHGKSMDQMIRNLSGPVNITATDGMISGFDLETINRNLSNLRDPRSLLSLLNTSMGKGQTPFSSFRSDIAFHNGIGSIQSMKLIANGGEGTASGQIDLPQYLLNVNAEFRLTQQPNLPPFRMQLTGPIDNPSRKLDSANLQKYMMENVFKGVISKLGKGKFNPTDLLGSVLGRGGGNESQPQQQPNNAPQSNKPEQIVKDVLGGLFK